MVLTSARLCIIHYALAETEVISLLFKLSWCFRNVYRFLENFIAFFNFYTYLRKQKIIFLKFDCMLTVEHTCWGPPVGLSPLAVSLSGKTTAE